MTAPTTTYRGHRDGDGRTVVVRDTPSGPEPLHHVMRHSPGGFEWGYGGSGPADLARSLLVDALGDDALCPSCRGHRPTQVGHRDDDGNRTHAPVGDVCAGCSNTETRLLVPISACPLALAAFDEACCDDRYSPGLPYQQFKWAVVARLDYAEWTLDQAKIRTWVADHARRTGAA